MGKYYFTEEQVKELKNNKYVKNVSEKAITYTDEFKIHFINEYNLGKLPKQIFKESGFNIKVLGDKRISTSTERFKRQNQRIEGLADTRANNSGRRRGKTLTIEEENDLLRSQNAKLQQELDFLKKMEYLARQAKKSKQ